MKTIVTNIFNELVVVGILCAIKKLWGYLTGGVKTDEEMNLKQLSKQFFCLRENIVIIMQE